MIIVQAPSREDAYDADGWELADDNTLTLTDADMQPVAVIQPAQWLTVRTEDARIPDRTAQERDRATRALRGIAGSSCITDYGVDRLRDIAGQALADIEEGNLP